MIVPYRQLLTRVKIGRWALPTFNTFNLEMTQAILWAAESTRAPLAIEISARAIQHGGGNNFLEYVRAAADQAKVPVALHFDHGESVQKIRAVGAAFFSSVMIAYDIRKSLATNIKSATAAVRWARSKRISVQGEVGHISGPKDHWRAVAEWLTKPDDAAEYVRHTGVDSLAVSVGNRHGIAAGSVQLDFPRIKAIRAHVNVPLVLHGGSGVRRNLYAKAVRTGIAAINFDTDLRFAFATTLQQAFGLQRNVVDPRNALGQARRHVARVVADKIRACRANGKV